VVAVAGQVGFVAAWIIGGLLQPGYSTADQTVSELFSRTAEHPVVLWIGLAGLAPSYLATAVILRRTLDHRGRVAVALFALAAPLVIIVLLAPLDCMTNGSAACAARVDAGAVSGIHHLHNLAAVVLQLLLVATPFAVAAAVRGSHLMRWALCFGALGVATVLAVAASDPGQGGYGIAQRATFGFVNLWVSAIAIAALAGIRVPARVDV
jgi:hypothetical protein